MCLRHYYNSFFEYFPEPINNLLCVNTAIHENVTTCVVDDCTAYEQGAYVVVAAIGCPEETFPTANVTLARVTTDLEEGGDP
ncbi:uncharacterized protein A1O5_12719 [Cladophialophora psammophila CBS 110553]|uniref:Uncharacterized protein n=1 Tax=Cladophialophora psammophila CBS 110553 TaxID=1182543 RepID=W9VL65_9EURO|nr:uncharacterized protein A1O5_12719 [Cladophialophora psammophila CBS 110553]EXJ56263.1 hypothetical protein A1O5_12719 [Cladophialophora psammophila CBS 110553]